MRRIAFVALAAAALAGCNQTDRDNIRNAAGNAASATGDGIQKGASAVENFATRTGNAVSNGARETYRSFNEEDRPAADANAAGKKSGN